MMWILWIYRFFNSSIDMLKKSNVSSNHRMVNLMKITNLNTIADKYAQLVQYRNSLLEGK